MPEVEPVTTAAFVLAMEHLFAGTPRNGRRRKMLRSPNAAEAALLHCNKDFASGHIGAWWDWPLPFESHVLRRSPRPLRSAGDRPDLAVLGNHHTPLHRCE